MMQKFVKEARNLAFFSISFKLDGNDVHKKLFQGIYSKNFMTDAIWEYNYVALNGKAGEIACFVFSVDRTQVTDTNCTHSVKLQFRGLHC